MARLAIAQLQPGMTVMENVMTPRQMLLLPAGAVLSETHLTTFRTWGIREVMVDAEDPNAVAPVVDAKVDAAQEEAVRERFAHADLSKPLAAALLAAALKQGAVKSS
ncbi:MAG: hypothetical protein RL095_3278 [Verrucomicrobiota bacterium]